MFLCVVVPPLTVSFAFRQATLARGSLHFTFELVIGETKQEAGLPYRRISDEKQLQFRCNSSVSSSCFVDRRRPAFLVLRACPSLVPLPNPALEPSTFSSFELPTFVDAPWTP
eukprot:scaffold37_cov346-Pavlova_lutheri.AAC.9